MSDEDDIRSEIVRTARELRGAHYLAGTYGQAPPFGDDSTTAQLSALAVEARTITFMTDRAWRTLAVRAVEINPYRGVRLRCCGNYGTFSGANRGGAIETSMVAPTAPVTAARPLLRALHEWYLRIATLPENSPTEPLHSSDLLPNDYFPRRHTLVGNDGRKVHFGQDCYGRKHFDCVGFVCYVLTKVLHPTRPIWIGLPRTGIGRWNELGPNHKDHLNCQRGDLFLSSSHIAIVSQGPPHLRLIHANGDLNGVQDTSFSREDSTWASNFQVVNLSRRFLGLSSP